jgi:tetratricopeptide (TPR) repeat protein
VGSADLDSDSARFALNSAVVQVLDAVSSAGRPALVVLDDLHWADAPTLALVRHLVERAPATPALVVGTFRDTDIDASHPLNGLLAATHREPGTSRVAVRGLDDGERAGEIAHHWVHAIGPQDRNKAAGHAQRAGDHALTHLAPDAAVTWYQQALELFPSDQPRRRCEILVGLGTAQRQAGDPAYRETLLEASHLAIDLGLDDLLVRAALANNRGEASALGAADDERIEIVRRAIAVQPGGPDGALLQAILAIEIHAVSAVQAEEAASRALEQAREAGDDRVMVHVARLAESALRAPQDLPRRQQILREGIAAATRTGDPQLRGVLSISHHELALLGGDRGAMDRERELRDTFSARSPEPFVRWTNAQTHATHLFLDGDLAGAEAAADAAFELGVATGQPEAFFGWAGQIFEVRRAQDRVAEVAEAIEQIHQENPTLQVFRAALAHGWCELGRADEARTLTDALDVSPDGAPQYWSSTLMLWAEVCHALELPEPAAQLVPLLQDWREQVASTGATTEGAIAHGLGLALATLGRDDEAASAFDLALDVNRRLRAPLFVARTQLAQAELVAGTDPERARALAAEATTVAERLGFSRISRHAAELLQHVG